jgi:hypothetical protein
MKLVVIGGVFLGAIGILIWLGVETIPVVAIQELQARTDIDVCRIDDGVIHSIERPADPLEFTIRSESRPDLLLAVRTPRTQPDNFKVGIKVSVKGRFDAKEKRFLADELMTKCPSRYEASKMPAEGGGAPAAPAGKVP